MSTAINQLVENYLNGVTAIKHAVRGMSREQLLAKPIADKWSTLEVVAHIADFEPILADRMKRIIALEKPLLLVADENHFVTSLAYQDRDLEEELAVIETTRKQMARILRATPAATFAKQGVHSLKGLVTLEDVVKITTNHVPHHLKFIADKRRALGLPE
jgi:hypothetical protein